VRPRPWHGASAIASTMRQPLLLLVVASLAGCLCPSYPGVDGVLEFRTCADPGKPVLRSSHFAGDLSEYIDESGTAWTSSDPAVVEWVQEADSAYFLAVSEGTSEVRIQQDDGSSDGLRYEVAAGASASWHDPIGAIAADSVVASPQLVFGEPLNSDPDGTLRVLPGATVGLSLTIRDGADRVMTWSDHAVSISGVGDAVDLGDASVAASGPVTVQDDGGAVLGTLDVVEGTLEVAELKLSTLLEDRDAIEQPEEAGEELLLAWIRAVVIGADGEPVHGATVTWTSRGAGQARGLWEGDDPLLQRKDVGAWFVSGDRWGALGSLSSCVVASIDGDEAAVWFGPDGAEIFEDGNCGDRGCGCSAASGAPASGLALLLMGLVGMRRRR